jgi:hypothetical protein
VNILLDECVPRKLGNHFPGHAVKTVVQVGWQGVLNGELLKKASADFHVFITVDRNLAFQQNPKSLPIPVIVIHSPFVTLKDLREFAPAILKILEQPLSKSFYRLGV